MQQFSSSPDRRNLLKQALDAVEAMKAKVRLLESGTNEPIAIIGAGCRLPGQVRGLEDYWQLLHGGTNAVTAIPPSRWGSQEGEESEKFYAGLVEGLESFDPQFFRISAREARTMDPQQRLVLEVSWEALENAGQSPRTLSGSQTGVFLGITSQEYIKKVEYSCGRELDAYAATGNAHNATPGRLSYLLGLQGPSMAIDSACSSSLVSLHLACQSLRAGECRLAIAGGVNTILAPEPFICFTNWGMLAADGRCKTFDARADGFVRGEGCGMVVLKRLSDAEADGDRILAVIRGSAVNQDGRSSGLTVPNGVAQEALLKQALANARVSAEEIGYVEAHGTGTSLGDPIEAHALARVLGKGRSAENPLVVGSVKTNLGHLEAAAGVAGLIKVVLSLEEEWIPQHLHFEKMNPHIDWQGVPVEIPVEGKAWRRGGKRRLAGVSSFGFSGTNAHVIVEEAPVAAERKREYERPQHILALSARSASALEKLVERYAEELSHTTAEVGDICYTANAGRAHFDERLVVVGSTAEQLRSKLLEAKAGQRAVDRDGIRAVFLFPGQGSQYAGMGKELYETQPVFRRKVEECAELLKSELEEPLLEVLWGARTELLEQTAYTQPALFAIEYGLAELWKSWGIEPSAVLGHSVGEYVAACVAGVYSLADGLKLIAARGRLMQQVAGQGAMASVGATEERVREALKGFEERVSVAGVNARESVVISGYEREVGMVEERLRREGVRVQRLAVSHGFHSPQMREMEEAFEGIARQIRFAAPRVRLISSVTGKVIGREELSEGGYWRRQVREPVRFQAAIETLAELGYRVFVEAGPGTVLSGLGRQTLTSEDILWGISLKKKRAEWETLLEALGRLYVRGAEINWAGFDQPYQRRRVALPTYPFERQRYWIDEKPHQSSAASVAGTPSGHPLLGSRIELASDPQTHVWENRISLQTLPYLADHVVQGGVILPATAYIEMANAAASRLWPSLPLLKEIEFRSPLFLGNDSYAIQVVFSRTSEAEGCFQIYGRVDNRELPWTLHARGKAGTLQREPSSSPEFTLNDFISKAKREISSGPEFYEYFRQQGNNWGPLFQGVCRAWISDNEAWTEILVPEPIQPDLHSYFFHPAVADACGHGLTAITAFTSDGTAKGAFVGESAGRLQFHTAPTGNRFFAHALLSASPNANVAFGNISIYTADGTLLSELEGAQVRYLEIASDHSETPPLDDWFYRIAWKDKPLAPNQQPADRCWIILADSCGVGEVVAEKLQQANCSVMLCRDLQELRTQFPAFHGSDCHIIDLRCLDANEPGKAKQSCWAVAELLRILTDSQSPGLKLWVATKGAQDTGSIPGPLSPWQSAVWGLGRTLAIEHAELWGGLIDLDPLAEPSANAELLLGKLADTDREDQIAFRAGRRLVARLERQAVPPTSEKTQFRSDGTYLITGGLGGLGLEIARWMAERGARRLILAGRTPLPPRVEWATLPEGSRHIAATSTILQLEKLGVSVHQVAIDVGDKGAVREFFERYAAECWPPIKGVVHAAGVLRHATVLDASEADFDEVFRSKVLGAWALHLTFQHVPLDFFVLFSSASGILSSPKLGLYAAANAFLDTLSSYRRQNGLAGLSIDWGVWTESGMASRFEGPAVQTLSGRGMGGMKTMEGLACLGRLLKSPDTSQVAVIPVNWHRWMANYPAFMAMPIFSEVAKVATSKLPDVKATRFVQEIEGLSAAQRESAVATHLQRILEPILAFAASDIDVTLPITDFGVDSMMALELKNRVESEFRVSLSLIGLLQGPNLKELAATISLKLNSNPPPADETTESSATDEFPLSWGQRALWFIHQMQPETAAYNISFTARAYPVLDTAVLERAFSTVVDHHPSLRTSFGFDSAGEPVQRVHPRFVPEIVVIDSTSWSEKQLRERVILDYQRPFRLDHPPVRFTVFRGLDSDILLLNIHHLIFDAWSVKIVFDDLRKCYSAESKRSGVPEPVSEVLYSDFTEFQGRWLKSAEADENWLYWQDVLAGELPVLNLSHLCPQLQTAYASGESVSLTLPQALLPALQVIAKQHRATTYAVLLAAFQILLASYSGQEDLIIGSPASGRNESRWAQIVGYFVNILPIRANLSEPVPFSKHLVNTKEALLGALAHQEFPFSLMVERLRLRRAVGTSPVFQAMFNFLTERSGELGRLSFGDPDCAVEFGSSVLLPYVIPQQEGQFDIGLEVSDIGGKLGGSLKYRTDILDRATAEGIAESYSKILDLVAREPDVPISELRQLIEAARLQREDILL